MPAIKSPPQNPPQYSQGQVTARGVFAEIDTLLARHRQKTSLTLDLPLQEKVQSILPTLGIKNIPQEKLNQIASDVAGQTLNQTLEDIAKVQTPEQISLVLADSLTQSIINHPDLAGKIKAEDDTKVFTKIVPHAQEVASQNQDILEKAAVLANLDNIAKIQDQTEQIKNLIAGSVEQTAETEAPLTPPAQKEALKADLANYLKAYKEELANQLKITADNIPTLKELQNVKENAHTQATKKTARATAPIGPKPAAALPTHSLTANLAQVLYLRPKPPTSAPLKLPAGGNLILSSPNRVRDAYFSLLAFDQEKLAKALKETSSEIEQYKNKKSLTYKERLLYQDALKKHARYASAQAFHVKQPKKARTYRTLFAQSYGGRNDVASGQTWIAEKYFLPSVPRIIAHNERLAAGAAFGSLGFSFAGINFGSLFSKIRGQAQASTAIGMGIAPANPIKNMARKITGIAGGVAGGLLLYFAGLGQAAFAGALIGGGIAATSGAIAGAVIPVAMLGPAGILLWPVTMPLGATAFGLVGVVAGGLIGLGIAAGSTTAISMGVGAGIGGVVGGFIGFGIGSAISGAFIAFAAAACAATGIGCILVPIAAVSAPVIVTISTAIGALIGSAAGAAIGYVIGNYIINPVIGTIKGAYAGISGISVSGGFLSSIGSFFTGLASTVWGGLGTVGGAITGFLSGAGNFLIGISGLSPSVALAAVPVAGSIGAIAIGGTIVGIVTATSFFNLETDQPTPITPPGENQFFKVTKTSSPQRIENNNDLPKDITFTINLTAKEIKLTNIQITDELKVQTNSGDFTVTQDKNGKPISPPCAETIPPELPPGGSWICQFTIVADTQPPERNFSDSVVANTVTVKATPEGKSEITDSAVAAVVIGNPPTICAIFEIQGPWSNDEKISIDEVCQTLDRSTKVVSLLQKAGTIFLIRVADGSLGPGVCGTVNGANTIQIGCNMANVVFAKYVIIHELGHVLGNYNGTLYNSFIAVYNQEGLMPTYPFANGGSSESFPEMIADFVISKSYNYPLRSWSNYPGGPWNFSPPQNGYTSFKNDRPAHYSFAKTDIFGGVEY